MPRTGGLVQIQAFLTCPPYIFDESLWKKDVLELKEDETEAALDEQAESDAKELGVLEVRTPSEKDVPDLYSEPSTATSSSSRGSLLSISSPSSSFTFDDSSSVSRDTPDVSDTRLSCPQQGFISPSLTNVLIPTPSLPRSAYSTPTDLIAPRSQRPYEVLAARNSLRKKPKKQTHLRPVNLTIDPTKGFMAPLDVSTLAASSYVDISSIALDCGHICGEASLKRHIERCLAENPKKWPSHCDISIPEATIRKAMTLKELKSVLSSPQLQSPADAISVQERHGVTTSITEPLMQTPMIDTFFATADPSAKDGLYLQKALEDPHFLVLRVQQREQFERAQAFEYRQRKALAAHHDRIRRHTCAMHAKSKKDRQYEDADVLDYLEEKHIAVESELLKEQEEERTKVAIRIRHMEAYCGIYPMFADRATVGSQPLPSPQHFVTEDDKKRLQQQYVDRDNLERKHQNAVNILRSRQEREMREQITKRDRTRAELDANFESYLSALDSFRVQDESRLQSLIASRQTRLLKRWDFRTATWRAKAERTNGEGWYARVPALEWPEPCQSDSDLKKDAGRSLDVLTRIERMVV